VVLCLLGITLLAAGLRWWMVTHAVSPSRDCLVFVRIALQLYDPPKSRIDTVRQLDGPADVLRETDQAPGYPVAILGMATALGYDLRTATADQMVLAARLVSVVAALLLTFPLFGVAARLFGPVVGLMACFWFQILPVFVEITSDGLSDGLFLLTAAAALWFSLNVLDRPRWHSGLRHGFSAGVCVGAGYLVRPDSLIVGLTIGLTFLGTAVARWARKDRGLPVFLGGVGLMFGTALLMYPYVSVIGKLTNKPAMTEEARVAPPAVAVPFAAWWNADKDDESPRRVWAVTAVGDELLKAGHYVLPCFAAAGLFWARRRLTDARVALPALLIAMHLGVLWYLAVRAGYVSQRHTMLSVMLGAVFAAWGWSCIGALASRLLRFGAPSFWAGAWVVIISASCISRDFRPMHTDRAGHREAGEWLASHANPHFSVVDPYGWAEFYSGRTVRGWSSAHPDRGPVVYTVFEPNPKTSHSRLPWLADAAKLAARGEIVFQYPADAPPDKVRVAVYRGPPLLQREMAKQLP